MGRDLLPESVVLAAVFPNASPASVHVLSNAWTVCTFREQFDTVPALHMPQDLIVRMEASIGNLVAVAALEDLAKDYTPALVPQSYGVG
jgi:hypothetical protein